MYRHHKKLAQFSFALLLIAKIATTHAGIVLEIMVEDEAAPWSQADGSGAANDIVKAAFAAAGVDVALHVVTYARCKHMVASGQIAACFSMSSDPSIANSVIFSNEPLYRNYAQYFDNSNHPLKATNESEVTPGTVIGIVTGYEYPDSVDMLKKRGAIFEAATSERANLKKLARGRIDAAVANLNEFKSVEFLTTRAGVKGAVTPRFRSNYFGSYIGFSVQHPKGLWARDKFNEGYAKISSDGTLQQIMHKWRTQSL